MNQFLLVFITGLTTGGVGCLAVQGGLLTTAITAQIPTAKSGSKAIKNMRAQSPFRSQATFSILLFLAAKLAAYTLLGFLLGALGAMFQLTAVTRAILTLAIGIFMVGNALRILDVHHIFRFFIIEPPAAVRRLLRSKAKNSASALAPISLGVLTILIPCGVTQAMMALAMTTGDALVGAGILAAFTLGSNMVFFFVTFLATHLGSVLEKNLSRIVAIILLVLGVLSIDSGLTLIGSPVSLARLTQAVTTTDITPGMPDEGLNLTLITENRLEITVTADGYSPAVLNARADIPTYITFVTDEVYACSLSLVFPELGIEKLLPFTGELTIEIPPQPTGKTIHYNCIMGCSSGQVVFDL